MVSSRYRLSHLFSVLWIVALGTVIFLSLKNTSPLGAVVLAYIMLGLLTITIYKSPHFTFSDDTIRRNRFFQRKIYTWNDVEEVYISSKEYYPAMLIGWPQDAMKLIFKDDTSFVLWDGVYGNMAAMRVIVTEKLNSRLHFVIPHYERNVQQTIVRKKYKGNAFTTFNTLLIAGIVIYFIILLRSANSNKLLALTLFLFALLLFIGEGFQMNYFEIETDKLIVRNQYFPWVRKQYNLNDIEEVSKENGFRISDGLRIITYNYNSKLYRAGSLWYHHWDELFKDLESLGIKIGDRSI